MTRPTDLREAAIALRSALALLRAPPPSNGGDEAVRAAWESIVAPHLETITHSMDGLADAGSWVLDDDDQAVRLKPDHWDEALRRLSELYAVLAGALAHYRGLRVEWGAPPPPAKPKGRAKRKRTKTAKRTPKAVLDARRREELVRLAAGITESLEGQRTFLQQLMQAVQRYVADMQKAEEEWLKPDCDMCFEGNADRTAEGRGLFEAMRIGRLNAEAFDGDPPETYGSMLRDAWRAPHLRVLALAGHPLPSTGPSQPTR